MRVRFWGVRGTIPVPGTDTVQIGGNTACIDILTSDRHQIILDAGSGIRPLGKLLMAGGDARITGTILISHTHWDHIQGFPFFEPVFVRNNRFIIVGQKRIGRRLEAILARQIVEPYLPFDYKTLLADVHVKEVENLERFVVGDETVVRVAELNHPGGCLGFRIENNGATVAYCTDTTHPENAPEPNVLDLAAGADLLIHDAHFSLGERSRFAQWGHSSWLEAALVAKEAQVNCLALFHFNPDATDHYLTHDMLRQAQAVFPNTILAREGESIQLPLP